MKEIILLSLAVYGLHVFAQNTDRTSGSMNSNVPPINTPDRTNGSMNSNVPPINTPNRTGTTVNEAPSTRAREAAPQGMPSRPSSSDPTRAR